MSDNWLFSQHGHTVVMCIIFVIVLLRPADGAFAAVPDSTMRILVPAYFEPSGSEYWDLLVTEAATMPGRLYAIANSDNGPGASVDSAYAHVIDRMHGSGGKVIGYVYTDYGAISIDNVKSDIDAWYSFYPSVDGIFLDCQAYVTGKEAYYVDLYQYIKQKDSTALVVSNPGINTIESYLVYEGKRVSDVICIFENSAGFDTWTPSTWCSKYSDSCFYVLPYHTSWTDFPGRVDRAASLHIGWIYCTDDIMPNPWDVLPPYFHALCHYVATGEVINPPPSGTTVITIDGHFSDWQGIAPLNTPPNPPPGSSPAPDAEFVNLWATNDSTNLYVSYQVAGNIKASDYFYHIFIDVDGDSADSTTGYVYQDSASIGAEFMVEGNYFYRYTGTGGSDWGWGSAIGMVKSDSADRSEIKMPLSTLFRNTTNRSVKLLFQTNLASDPYTFMSIAPADYQHQCYSYSLVGLTGIQQTSTPRVQTYSLSQNFPNPFNPSTTIEYEVTKTGPVQIDVFNVLGQHIATLVNEIQTAGTHRIRFHAADLASGTYFYSLQAGGFKAVKRMLLLK